MQNDDPRYAAMVLIYFLAVILALVWLLGQSAHSQEVRSSTAEAHVHITGDYITLEVSEQVWGPTDAHPKGIYVFINYMAWNRIDEMSTGKIKLKISDDWVRKHFTGHLPSIYRSRPIDRIILLSVECVDRVSWPTEFKPFQIERGWIKKPLRAGWIMNIEK
jgi:hypothetical protein